MIRSDVHTAHRTHDLQVIVGTGGLAVVHCGAFDNGIGSAVTRSIIRAVIHIKHIIQVVLASNG